jgi:hypothetical protein
MTSMKTSPAAPDLDAITDLVLTRQLINIDRSHARGIVAMVLECAAEAAGPVEPPYEPTIRRINGTVDEVSTLNLGHGFCDHISYRTGWDGSLSFRSSAYTPPRNTEEPTNSTRALKALVGNNLALWVADDDPFYAMPTLMQYNDLGTGS